MSTAPGVVFSMRFVQAAAANDHFSRYAVGYMSRPQAFEEKEHEGDALYHDADPRNDQYGYMSNKDKTDGLFDAKSDLVSEYDQYRYTGIFDASQVKDCPLYQGVISFRNEFLQKYQIDYQTPAGIARLKQIARLGISDMIHASKLSDDNVVWTAAIHTNTDNIHVHIAIVEKEKVQRRYDKLETEAFDKLKSRVANAIVGDREKVELSQIFQRVLPHEIQTVARACGAQLDELLRMLPNNVPWQYNREGMAPYRAVINECVDKVIASSELLSARFNQGMESLHRYDQMIREMYGDAKYSAVYDEKSATWSMSEHKTRELAEHAAENKLKDFYARAGNTLLGEARTIWQSRGAVSPDGAAMGAEARLAGVKRTMPDMDNIPEKLIPESNSETPVHDEAPINEIKAIGDDNMEPSIVSDEPDTIDRLIMKSGHGDTWSMYQLAQRFLKGDGFEKDIPQAIELLSLAANLGNPYAAHYLAGMYRDGDGVDANVYLTDKYFYLAAKGFSEMENISGDARLQYRLGTMYQYGEGIPIDPVMAEKYYSLAADQKDVRAQLALARLYVEGEESIRNVPEGIRILKQMAEEGSATACYRLGRIYKKGEGMEQNPAEAKHWFRAANEAKRETHRQQHNGKYYAEWTDEYREARKYLYGAEDTPKDLDRAFDLMIAQAEDGNAFALFDLARMCADGLGVEADQDYADRLYSRALKAFMYTENRQPNEPTYTIGKQQKDKASYMKAYLEYRIGKMVHAGLGTERDDTVAAHWFQQSADQENKFAQYSLGTLYYAGQGVDQIYETAMHYYELSSKQGNAYASYELAKMYRDGVGIPVDPKQADKYFQIAFHGFEKIEEKNPDDKIEYRLGKMLETGTGTSKNIDQATEYYTKSSELNNSFAQYALAKIYIATGDQEKKAQAIKWLEKSADQSNQFAQYTLGQIYLSGKEVGKDIPHALQLLNASADQGNQFAQYSLGRLYLAGENVDKDVPHALQMLSASADQGNRYAQYSLGQLYLAGEDVKKDIPRALQLLDASADQGNQFAQYALGRMYLMGEDVDKNVSWALKLLDASADQGNQFAQYTLGRLYLDGEEVGKDIPRALQLLISSANQGNQYAQYALGREYMKEGKTQKALQYFRLSAVQGNTYARQSIDRIVHPAGRMKEGVNRLRAATSINREIRRMAREYERDVRQLQREFERDQDEELERSKEQSI